MRYKEFLRKQKEEMSPLRWKMNYVVLPVFIVSIIFPVGIVLPFMTIDANKYGFMFFLWMAWIVLACTAMLCSIPYMTKKETRIELERYGYLFQEPKPLEAETLTVCDEALVYTLDKEGARLEFPMEGGGQVFDEVNENSFYIPWERADFALATQTYWRRVHIALAILPLDMNTPPFFVPLNEEVFSLIKSFGFEEKLGGEWAYLFYNPEDAFKQILTKGRIIKMRNKKTGKIFVDKHGG